MSRIGKLPITVPSPVSIKFENGVIEVSGPKGTLYHTVNPSVQVALSEGKVDLTISDPENGDLHGLTRTLISNMVKGVTDTWSKTLELSGTGFRASTTGSELNLALGFSHPVVIKAPAGITFEVKENKIAVKGADKAMVGEIAANIRKLKPADPYKAKGFKYEGEIIIRKAGKAAKAAG